MTGETSSQTDRPSYSIIMAAYNASATIADAIDSVLAQTQTDWQLVAVDDGSTDDTADVVAAYAAADSRIVLVRQSNAGTACARNAGAQLASGRWWVFLDADDMLLPQYLEKQSAFMTREPGYDIYSTNADYLLRDGSRRAVWRGRRFQQPLALTAADQFGESSILLMATITPRVFELTGGFRTLHSEDYDFWLRALILGATHRYNPEVLAVYRRAEGTRTTSMVAEAESFLRDSARSAPDAGADTVAARGGREGSRALRGPRHAPGAGGGAAGRRLHARAVALLACTSRLPRARAKYLLGLAIISVSPRAYARIKSGRMI